MTYLDTGMPVAADAEPQPKKELEKPAGRLRRYWREIAAYDKAAQEWKDQGDKIVRLYEDQNRTVATPRRFALLWSNIETLKPAVYAKCPTILCSRRYKDPDPIGRTAAEMMERATNTTFDLYNADEVLRMVRDDRLLVGRGQAWVRYEADFKKVPATKFDDEYDRKVGERVVCDYVPWKDFGHNVTGTWGHVWVVWRRIFKTKEEVEKRFGKEVADALTYVARTADDGKTEEAEYQAVLYEIWDKKAKKTVFIAKDHPKIIEEIDPPIDFRRFFPCPEPCYGSKSSRSLIPTPDYRYYQDQAQEIDDLTEKIAVLTEYLMVRAFIPAGPSADGAEAVRMMVQTLQNAMTSNKSAFVPVESWAGFTSAGGAKGLIDWLPLDIVIVALKGAIDARNQLIQDVYQITGIADILRGQTDPNETLGAQQIKAQTGQRRTRNAKDELARFAKDLGMLVAEVISEQFDPKTLAEITGFQYQPMLALPMMAPGGMPGGMPGGGAMMQMPAPLSAAPVPAGAGLTATAQPAPTPMEQPDEDADDWLTFDDRHMKLLRDDRMRNFLIDVETDSTIQPDEDAEKQRRTEFIQATGMFLKQMVEVVGAAPTIVPMVTEMLLFGVRGFRVGRALEDVIERSMKAVQAQAMQPKQDPEMLKLQAEQDNRKKELGMKFIEMQWDKDRKDQEAAQKIQLKEAEGQQKLEIKQQEGAIEAQQGQQELQQERELGEQKIMLTAIQGQQQVEQKDQAHQQGMLQKEQAHRQGLAHQKAMNKAKPKKPNGKPS